MLSYDQQVIAVIPSRDLVLVRLGLRMTKTHRTCAEILRLSAPRSREAFRIKSRTSQFVAEKRFRAWEPRQASCVCIVPAERLRRCSKAK